MFTTLIMNWKLVLIAALVVLCLALTGTVMFERQVIKVKTEQLEKKDLEIKVLVANIAAKDETIKAMEKNIAEVKKSESRMKGISEREAGIAANIIQTSQKPCEERKEENAKNHTAIVNFFNGTDGVRDSKPDSNASVSTDKLPETRKASARGH